MLYNNTDGEYSVYLSDYAGKGLSGEKISFELDSENYTAITDSNGMARINVNIANPGPYQIISKFLGNTLNKAISLSNIITMLSIQNMLTMVFLMLKSKRSLTIQTMRIQLSS